MKDSAVAPSWFPVGSIAALSMLALLACHHGHGFGEAGAGFAGESWSGVVDGTTDAVTGPKPPKPPKLPPPPPPPPPSRPENNCSDRVVSRSKPCSNDPDPCGLNSGWGGDEYCLKPPPEGEGIQIHFGPKDYKDANEVAKYALQPGEEFYNSVLAHVPLTEDKWFDHIQVQMRPTAHRWISMGVEGQPEEGVYLSTACDGDSLQGPAFGGGQNLVYDNPPHGVPAPENEGLGQQIAGNSSVCLALHSYNLTELPQLREVWVNIYFVDRSEVTQRASGIGMVGGLGLNLPPGEKTELHYQGTFSEGGRIIQLAGQRLAWTPRLAAWLNDELIYDSHDWKESVTYNYDSITMNPPLNPEARVDGAASGILEFRAGDTLSYSCFIDNQSDQVLRFKNDLATGEMCLLWGATVGGSLSGTFP